MNPQDDSVPPAQDPVARPTTWIQRSFSRRDTIRIAGTSLAATSIVSALGHAAPASAPISIAAPGDCGVIVQELASTHFLSAAAIKSASAFPLGTSTVDLGLNTKAGIVGAVHEFVHTPEQAKLLKRTSSVLECAVVALSPAGAGSKAVQAHLAKHKVPLAFQQNARMAALTVRRRNTTATDKLDLSKQFTIAEQLTFVATFAKDAKGHTLAALTLPTFTGKVSKKQIRPGVHFKFVEETPDAPPPPAPTPEETAEEKDFMGCFLPCLAAVAGLSSPVTGTFCAACLATIAALPPTAGLDTPAVLVACGGCFFFFLAPIVTCFGMCEDQL